MIVKISALPKKNKENGEISFHTFASVMESGVCIIATTRE
jgi:hypothetical protein